MEKKDKEYLLKGVREKKVKNEEGRYKRTNI